MKKSTYRRTNARWFGLIAMLFVAVGCSQTATKGSSPAASGSPTPTAASIDGAVLGGGTYPSYTVRAPSPWSTPDGHFVMNHTGGVVLGLSVWDVGLVAHNPCHSVGHLFDPGPTVTDLVAALEAQSMRNATSPTDVTLGGHRARYLEWSVPAHMVVTGVAEFAGCDVQGNGHRDFVSWDGNGLGERYEQVAGEVDRLWILNVDGQRLLVDATYSPDTSQAQRDELDQIAKSIRFSGPTA